MNKDLYSKLVDLYAGDELPAELVEELESAAMEDPVLSHDMYTLKKTVEILKSQCEVEFTDESYYRIMTKMELQGVELSSKTPEPTYIQYHLPIQG